MVCSRCIRSVESILTKLGIEHGPVILGEVPLSDDLEADRKSSLAKLLEAEGFELIDDKKQRVIEKIKKIVIERVNSGEDEMSENLSTQLSTRLNMDYSYLSSLFSQVEGITIERYYIANKIEKVKELLVYDEESLSQISFRMGYSSVQHLSNQFKKITGLTPSHFRQIGAAKRKSLDEL